MPPKEPTRETPAATPRPISPAILAARAFNRIEALITQRDAELANAPESIAARFQVKIEWARKDLDGDAAELLDGMLEKAGLAERDEGPVSE